MMITKSEAVIAPNPSDYPGVKESTRRILAEEERQVMEMIREKALKTYDQKRAVKQSPK